MFIQLYAACRFVRFKVNEKIFPLKQESALQRLLGFLIFNVGLLHNASICSSAPPLTTPPQDKGLY